MECVEEPFLYKPLDATRNEIRLLGIQQKDDEWLVANLKNNQNLQAPLQCRLETVPGRLFPTDLHVGIGAILKRSYTWGNEPATEKIYINGCLVLIRKNLEEFLRRAAKNRAADRKAGRNVLWLWIDALCINQDDIDERNLQVKRMAQIYKQAFRVVAWLGTGGGDTHLAVQLVRKVALASAPYQSQGQSAKMGALRRELAIGNTAKDLQSWAALAKLCCHSYWRRLWVLQEIVLSDGLLLVSCGSSTMLWADLVDAASLLHGSRNTTLRVLSLDTLELESAALIRDVSELRPLTEYMYSSDNLNTNLRDRNRQLLRMLETVRRLEARDPRDMIYGALNLFDVDISNQISPCYDQSVAKGYIDFAYTLAVSTNSLDILSVHVGGAGTSGFGLPSWVPDWSSKKIRISSIYWFENAANASAGMKLPSGSFLARPFDRSRVLALRGVRVGRVDGRACGCYSSLYNGHHTVLPTKHTVEGSSKRNSLLFWKRKSDILPKPKYHTPGPELTTVDIWRTMNFGHIMDRGSYTNATVAHHIFSMPLQCTNFPDSKEAWNLLCTIRNCFGNFWVRESESFLSLFPETDFAKTTMISPGLGTHITSVREMLAGRTLVTTDTGLLCLAPAKVQKHDVLCILAGCKLPVVMRPFESMFKLLGECYVNRMMDGEAMEGVKTGQFTWEEFNIV